MKKLTTILLTSICTLTFINSSFAMENKGLTELLKENSKLLKKNNALVCDSMLQTHLLHQLLYYQTAKEATKNSDTIIHCSKKENLITTQLATIYKKHNITLETVASHDSSEEV